jgi:Saxitoxin biosynthesis operon protein SxtJ
MGLFISAYLIWVNPSVAPVIYLASGSIVFILAGYLLPILLYPLWKAWMKFGELLGLVMSFLVLGAIWVTMFIPLGLLFKLFGKKVMEVSFNKEATTYWIERDHTQDDFKLLERQY